MAYVALGVELRATEILTAGRLRGHFCTLGASSPQIPERAAIEPLDDFVWFGEVSAYDFPCHANAAPGPPYRGTGGVPVGNRNIRRRA